MPIPPATRAPEASGPAGIPVGANGRPALPDPAVPFPELLERAAERRCRDLAEELDRTRERMFADQRCAEDALRESEAGFHELVEAAGEAFFLHDADGRLLDANVCAAASLGYSRDELLGLSVADIDRTFDREATPAFWRSLAPGESAAFPSVHRRRDGGEFPVEVRLGALGFVPGAGEDRRRFITLVRDARERQSVERELAAAREENARLGAELASLRRESRRLAAAVESAQTGILISDPNLPDAPVVLCNTGFTRVTGYRHDEIVDHNCRFLQGPGTDPATVAAIREAVAEAKPFKGVILNYKKDGTPFWNELITNPVFDEAGKLINFVGLQSDVTERVEALEALRQSQQRFARMTANIPSMVYQMSRAADGVELFTYASEGCLELFELDPGAVCADAGRLFGMIHPEDSFSFRRAVIESAQLLVPLFWEGRFLLPSGAERWVQGAARPERQAGGGTLWDGLFLDVTERRRAGVELQERTEQAAAVARLGQSALEGADHGTLFREAAHAVAQHLKVEQCVISELLPGGDNLAVRAAAGWRGDIIGELLGVGAASQAGFAIQHREPLLVEDFSKERRFQTPPPIDQRPVASGLSVVIHGKDRPCGVLCVQTASRRRFQPEDVSFAQAVANVLASALDRTRDESALRKSEAHNAAILETVLDSIITIDCEGQILDLNPAAESTFGHERAALLGQKLHGLILPAPPHAGLPAYLTAGEGSALGRRIEIPARHADGRTLLAELSLTRIPVEGLPQFTAYLRDITERRAADDRLRMLQSSVFNANDVILITEAEPVSQPGPRIIYVNKAFTKATGYTPEEVIGLTPRILQGPNTSEAAKETIRRALKRWKPVRVELINYRKDGSEFWVELNIVPVANDKGWFTHWVSVQRDITERKRAEAGLSLAKDAAEAADRAKSEFLSRMSHELRTPLNAILGFGQLLELQTPAGSTEHQRVSHIVKAGRHLLALINEVLDISRIETGDIPLTLDRVGVGAALAEAMDLIRPLAEERRVTLTLDPDGLNGQHVHADSQRLKQVLLNLLANAVKYNRDGGSVRVACRPGDDPGASPSWRILVADTGPGIPDAKRARLFQPFDRLGAEGSGIVGTGLGLALSKNLVEAMNGAIGVEGHRSGEGATFWVQLPEAPDKESAPEEISKPRPEAQPAGLLLPAAPRTVLLIEDNLSNQILIEHLLARYPGIRLLSAMQGRLGLELARRHRPDLILLDVHLPDLNGAEVLARLQADDATRAIPVVALSADGTQAQIDRVRGAGARDYLTKPLEAAGFFRTLQEILGS